METNNNGSGNVYVVRGVQKKSLTLKIGKTYKFEHLDAHPLRFSTTQDGTHSGGVEYTSGVDTSQNGITLITISADTPTNLYYYCSIHSGMGGEIVSSGAPFPNINISNQGVLTFDPTPDFESLASFSAKATVSDGENSTHQDIQVDITDIEQEGPTFNSASTFTVDENTTEVGTISADDPFGSAVTYSLSGTDAESFNLNQDSGLLVFIDAPDYEIKSSYSILVTATGGTGSTEQTVNVVINNLNDNSPLITSSNTFSADENQTSIGSIVAEDADGDSISYSISSNDILIDPNNGLIVFSSSPDYETISSYSAIVSVSDGENSSSQVITVNINNLNDNSPIFTSSSTFSINENELAVATVTATDADNDDITFTVSGSDLSITSNGVLTFNLAPDFESQSTYSATISASDSLNISQQTINISIVDVNEAPQITSNSSFTIDENETEIGTVTGSDQDGDNFTFTISGSEINIGETTGLLTFASAPDYETKSSYTATVTVSDGTLSSSQNITISVNNLNDNSPVITSSESFSADENQTAIGTVTATDADNDDITFSISGSELAITTAGVLTFASAPDYETKSSYTATLTASDGANNSTQSITVSVNNLNDNSPEITSSESFSADENQTAIGTVEATDADNDDITFSISGSEINIGTTTGVITFNSAPDYETKSSYTATVTATDGTNNSTQNITISVNNINDNNPVITSSATFSADENQTAIGTVTATDADGNSISFSISGSEIAITSAGVLTFTSAPDYETKSSYTATVTATDGANIATQNITVNVNNINDNSPVITSSATFSADENQTAIGTVTATDADNDDITFSISGSEINIGETTGLLIFASAPDYETKSSYTATVTATDGSNTSTQDITVSINNIDDTNPYFWGLGTNTINIIEEHKLEVALLQARDEDTSGNDLIWTLGGADSSSFEFKGAQTGSNYSNNMLLLKSDSDYETKSQYSVSVTLSDGTNSTSEDLTINVIDAHDRVGQIIEGTNDYERFGSRVKISGDGKTIIVSSLGPDTQEEYQSKVSIYKLDNNSWSLSKTFGPGGNSNPALQGHSIDINDDGNIIAYSHKNDGVYIYEYDGSSQWTQKGSVIKIKTANNSPLLSLNAPGNSILVEEGGDIKVFDYRKSSGSGTDWIQRGDTIQLLDAFGDSGLTYLALSPDGNAFAISSIDESPSSSSCSGSTAARGVLRVYKWGLESWSIKDTLTGCDVTTLPSNAYSENPNIWVYYGYSIDFTSDSKWLLIGSRADYNITWSTSTSGSAYADSGVYQIYNIASSSPKFYGTPLWVADTGGYSYVSDSGGFDASSGGGGLIDWKDSEGNTNGEGGQPRIYIQEHLEGEWGCENRACSFDGFSDGTSSWERNARQLSSPSLRQFTFDGSSWSAGEAVVRGNKFNRGEFNWEYSTNISGITNDGSRVIFANHGPDKCLSTCEEATKGYVDVKDIRASSAPATKFSLDLSEDVTINENGGSIQITTNDGSGGSVVLGGRDAGYFTVNPNNVAGLFFSTNANYEATNYPEGDDRFRLQLSVTDGVYWASKHLNVQIGDINDSPFFTSSASASVDENQQSVITLAASDEDGDTLTFAIDGGTDASLFTVNSSTGVLTFVSSHTPDYETKTSYSITVSVSDGTATTQQNLTVSINNINDQAPVFTSDATFSTPEFNTTVSGSRTFTIGEVDANDPDGLSNISYSISGSEISIDSSSGVIAFVNEADYETKNTYTATVTASDGGLTAEQNITVNVTNSNDNDPVFTSSETFSANENQTAIGTVTATDADNDTITFTVSGDNLQITSAGVLSFITAPDYETKNSYTGTVTASDNSTDPVFGARETTQNITVNIVNLNDNSPIFTSNATFSAEENQTAIGTVTASDSDGNGITYSISGSDITIDASSGVIAFVSAPDYETTTSYSATVTASDGSNSATQNITVNIQNIPNVSGVAYASRYSVMDSDIPNTEYFAYSNNDFTNTAQALISPSIVTGHVGGDDGIDIFSVSTTSSMYVNLDVIDYEDDVKELRVNIYESDGTLRETTYTSASEEYNMTILLPSSGNYFIVVNDLYGSSNYILTLGQRYNSSAYETSTDFIPDYISNEFIGYTPDKIIDSENKNNISEDELRQLEAKKLELFKLTGETFDQPGVKKFNMKPINDLQSNLYDAIDNNAFGNESSGLAPLTQKQLNYFNHWSYLQKLRKLSSGTIFDFNYRFETTNFSRDPEYSKQWNLERVQLEPVLNSLGQDVKDIAVAVIDSGGPTPGSTAWNESNLIDGGYDFVYGNSNSIDYLATSSYTGQDISHGTHVSTTIAAKNNGTGINGYAINALNINVFNVNGTGSEAETGVADQTDIINAILYAAGLSNSSGSFAPSSTPIKVINLSIANREQILYPTAYCAAVQNAVDQGITVVAAAGNQQDVISGLVSYPASCVGAISVGATNSAGNISYYSQQNANVDISAPGGGVTDLDGDGNLDLILAYGNNSELKQEVGTSMASPQVAAAIALMYSVDSTLTPARVDSMLANGELTDDKGVSGRDDVYGYGELNLVKAIRNIQEDAGVSASFGYTSTSFLEFGSETTQLTVDLIKVGSSSLSFSSLTSPNGTGLTYNQTSVDAEGFGTYTLFIDRSSIPNGEYSTLINFVLSDGSKVAVRVYYNVGALRSRPNIGKVYIGMYDHSDDSLWGYGELEVDGSVSFVANDVSPGDYYIVTSTDINDNNSLCEYGELCEYYPRLSETATYFTVSDSNLSGYEIYLNPRYRYGGPNAASLSTNRQPSKINKNIAKEKNIEGIEKIILNSTPPTLPNNPIEKGNNLVVTE